VVIKYNKTEDVAQLPKGESHYLLYCTTLGLLAIGLLSWLWPQLKKNYFNVKQRLQYTWHQSPIRSWLRNSRQLTNDKLLQEDRIAQTQTEWLELYQQIDNGLDEINKIVRTIAAWQADKSIGPSTTTDTTKSSQLTDSPTSTSTSTSTTSTTSTSTSASAAAAPPGTITEQITVHPSVEPVKIRMKQMQLFINTLIGRMKNDHNKADHEIAILKDQINTINQKNQQLSKDKSDLSKQIDTLRRENDDWRKQKKKQC